jgi:hypothetical protein
MYLRQPEGAPTLVGYKVVLQPADVPNHQPDPLCGRHFDRRRQEGVLGHADYDLAPWRRRAREKRRAANQRAQSPHRRPS